VPAGEKDQIAFRFARQHWPLFTAETTILPQVVALSPGFAKEGVDYRAKGVRIWLTRLYD